MKRRVILESAIKPSGIVNKVSYAILNILELNCEKIQTSYRIMASHANVSFFGLFIHKRFINCRRLMKLSNYRMFCQLGGSKNDWPRKFNKNMVSSWHCQPIDRSFSRGARRVRSKYVGRRTTPTSFETDRINYHVIYLSSVWSAIRW